MTRIYKLMIKNEAGVNILDIESHNSPFQITFSTTFVNLENCQDLSILEIYNLHIDQSLIKQFLQRRIVLIAGTTSSDISELQGINPEYLKPNVILNGYIYDAYFDYTNMPDVKLSIKIQLMRDNVLYSKLWKNNPILKTLEEKQNYLFYYNKGEDIIETTQTIFEIYTQINYGTGGSYPLHNITFEETLINYVADFPMRLNPFNNFWLEKLNDYLKEITKFVLKDSYPLMIVGTPRGYAISYNYNEFTEETWSKFLKSFGRYITSTKVPASISNAPIDYKSKYIENKFLDEQVEMYPESYEIPLNILLQPPVRVNFNIIQIRTILMPNIKPGDRIVIGKLVSLTANGTHYQQLTPSISSDLKTSSLAFHNTLAGTFVVLKVSHNLNYSGSDPVNWSTILELEQHPESESVKPEDMYINAD